METQNKESCVSHVLAYVGALCAGVWGPNYYGGRCPDTRSSHSHLKGLSHDIFGPVYWPVWMHLGLNKSRFWLLNFEEASLI